MKIWVRDNTNGKVFEYGKDSHDSLRISENGRCVTYYNLQNGDGSMFGSLEKKVGYNFVVDKDEPLTPYELSEKTGCIEHETDCFANIGGFDHGCKCKKSYQVIEELMDVIDDLEVIEKVIEIDVVRDGREEIDIHEVLQHAITLLKGDKW